MLIYWWGIPVAVHYTSLPFFRHFNIKLGIFYNLTDIVELYRGVASSEDKYRYFERNDHRRNMGITALDGRVFFAISNFNQSSPKFNVYLPETVDQQLDKAVEQVVNEMVETDMNLPGILLPPLYEIYSEELKAYSQKKTQLKKHARHGMG